MKIVKKILSKDQGFSLAETAVAMGIAGLVGMATFSLFLNVNESNRRMNAFNDLQTNLVEINDLLSKPDSCKKTFETTNLTVPGTGVSDLIFVHQNVHASGQITRFKAGNYYPAGSVQITSMEVGAWDQVGNPTLTGDTRGIATLLINYEVNNGKKMMPVIKRVYFNAIVDGAGTLLECKSTSNAEMFAACVTMGGTLNGVVCENMELGDITSPTAASVVNNLSVTNDLNANSTLTTQSLRVTTTVTTTNRIDVSGSMSATNLTASSTITGNRIRVNNNSKLRVNGQAMRFISRVCNDGYYLRRYSYNTGFNHATDCVLVPPYIPPSP